MLLHKVWKSYSQQFSLPNIPGSVIKKKLQGTPKGKKQNKKQHTPQFEETEQLLELEIAGMWSDQEFKTNVINMLSALMNKVETMQEQMGTISRQT